MTLHIYSLEGGQLRAHCWSHGEAISPDTLWLDLHEPTREEELAVEQCLGMDIPTREEMKEIEISNRLYDDAGHLFMTASLVAASQEIPALHAVTFIVAAKHLITVRYSDHQPFRNYSLRLGSETATQPDGFVIFAGLLETIINRAADILENIAQEVDAISAAVFTIPQGRDAAKDSRDALNRIGKTGDLTSKVRESLTTLWRVSTFASQHCHHGRGANAANFQAHSNDIVALNDHAGFLSNKLAFLLDATLGMINIEQNNIIKIFSIAAVVFLPPTLVASVYGMNFHHMPELDWRFGYPMAIALMIVAAVLPLWYFKRKKWL